MNPSTTDPAGTQRPKLVSLGCGVSIVVIAAAGLAGWILDLRDLTTWHTASIPVAPLSTLLFLWLGGSLLLASTVRDRPSLQLTSTALAAAGALLSMAVMIHRINGPLLPAEMLGLQLTPLSANSPFGGTPIGFTSPITAISLLVIHLSLLGSLTRMESSGSWLHGAAAVIAYFGLALVVTSIFGTPFLSGLVLIPVSLPEGVGILLSGAALWSLAPQAQESHQRMLRWFLVVFLVMSAAVLASGYTYYQEAELAERGDIGRDLLAAAVPLTTTIDEWRQARRNEAAVLRVAVHRALITRRSPRRSTLPRRFVESIFRRYQAYGNYDRLFLFDDAGICTMSMPDTGMPPPEAMLGGVRAAMQTRQSLLQDFYYDPNDAKSYLAIIAPIVDEGGTSIGAMAMRIDPELGLLPHVERLSGIGPSLESALVRRDGSVVQYLSHLHVGGATVAGLTQAVTRQDESAVQAVAGRTGMFQAVSHSGQQVLAVASAVPGSAWYLIVQVNTAVLRERVRQQLQVVTTFIVLLLVTTGGGLGLLLLEGIREYSRERLRLAGALGSARAQVRHLLSNSPTIIYAVVDRDGQMVPSEVSDNVERILGYSSDEALRADWWPSHLHADDRDAAIADRARLKHVDELEYEYRFHRANGSVIWIHDHLRVVERAGSRALVAVGAWYEVTDRRRVEMQLRESEERLQAALVSSMRQAQLYATLSHCNEAIVRSKSQAEMFPAICAAAVEHGGMSMVAVSLADPETGRVTPVASHGKGTEYLEGLDESVRADSPLGQGPTGVSIRENRAVWVDDVSTDARLGPWRSRASQYGWISSAALPLRRGGRAIGTLNIFAATPGAFDDESRGLLLELASNVSFALDAFDDEQGRRAAEAMAQSSLREKEALLHEVHHRVKNNLQVISSLLRLEAARREGHVRHALHEMQTRVLSMALLHETLYRSGNMAGIDLGTYLPRLATQIVNAHSRSAPVTLHVDVDHVSLQLVQAVPFGLIVNELVSNSLKHGFPNRASGEVRIELHAVDGGPAVELTVADNGVGLPTDFEEVRQRSLGLQLVSDLTRELRGELEWQNGSGAVFTVTFTPRTADADSALRRS